METTEASVTSDLVAMVTEVYTDGSSDEGRRGLDMSCRLYSFFMRVLYVGVVIIFGLVGNGLTLRILWHDLHKSATVFLLFALAVSDLLLLLVYGTVSIPSNFLRFLGRSQEATYVASHVSRYFSSMGPTSIMISMGLTVVVTWQRYVSVCMPYKMKSLGSPRLARMQALAVVIFSVVFNLPRWFQYTIKYGPAEGQASLVYTTMYKNQTYQLVYGVILYYIMLYVLPILALSYMTFALIRALHQARIKRQHMVATTSSSKDRSKEELTLSLVIVVLVFIICHFFSPIRRILILLYTDPADRQCGGIHYYFGAISLGATVTNSAVNFVIYILCAKRFRRQFMALCPCTRVKVKPMDSQNEGEYSGNTLDGTFQSKNSTSARSTAEQHQLKTLEE